MVVLSGLVAAPAASAKLFRGFLDPIYRHGTFAERTQWFDRSVDLGANVVRIDISWSGVAQSPPANPRDPGDPAYDFGSIDRAARDAGARGLPILFTFQHAPSWAEGKNRDTPYGGVWKVRPKPLGHFAQAVAARYSGSYSPGLGEPPLPMARFIEPWNEPNLPHWLSPQWKGKKRNKPASPKHYRKMLNSAYAGANRGNSKVKIVGGATSPYGDDPGGGERMRPLRFLRELVCLKKRKLQKKKRCKPKAKFDVFSHHPISTSGGARRSAVHRDDASVPDFKHVRKILRAAERQRTIRPRGRRPAWATEVWWESDPPDSTHGFPMGKVKRWVPEAMYLLWKQGAKSVIWLQIVDTPSAPTDLQTGMFFSDGTPKPLAAAWRFPFVTDRVSKKRLRVWAVAPSTGRLQIQKRRKGSWRTVKRVSVKVGKPKQTKIRHRGKGSFRAVVNGLESPVWREKRKKSQRRSQRSAETRSSGGPLPGTVPELLEPYIETP